MIQPIGFIKIHRELASKPIWKNSTPEQKVIIITLLMMADFRPNQWEWKGQKFITEPGQFVTSLDSIVQECGKGVTNRNVRTMLGKLEKCEFLTNEPTSTGRLITIANWGLYQVNDRRVTNELTKDRQTTDKRVTNKLAPKEEVRSEEEEEVKKKRFKPPTLQEICTYIKEKDYSVDAQRFFDYFEAGEWHDSEGKPVKNWKQKIVTWNKKAEKSPSTIKRPHAVQPADPIKMERRKSWE